MFQNDRLKVLDQCLKWIGKNRVAYAYETRETIRYSILLVIDKMCISYIFIL